MNYYTKVPRNNLYVSEAENSPYSNFEFSIKNCYLTVGGNWNEDCAYGTYYIRAKDCFDNYWLFDSQKSYENLMSYNLYSCNYLEYSENCKECFFLIGPAKLGTLYLMHVIKK